MAKNIDFGYEARQKLIKGVNKLSNSVAITLGPRGRNVYIGKQIRITPNYKRRRYRSKKI